MENFKLGVERLEEAYKRIDENRAMQKIEFVNCNKGGFNEVRDFVFNNTHSIYAIKIKEVQEKKIIVEYRDVPIHISLNIHGAY